MSKTLYQIYMCTQMQCSEMLKRKTGYTLFILMYTIIHDKMYQICQMKIPAFNISIQKQFQLYIFWTWNCERSLCARFVFLGIKARYRCH